MKIKSKRHKKCVIKRKFKLEDYKNCLDEAKIENKILMQIVLKKIQKNSYLQENKLTLQTQQRFKTEKHIVFIEEINKMILSSNHDERIQSYDSI